jgi:hypothetical protein
MQLKAVVFIIHREITLHVSCALCTHQEYTKTVDAITGTIQVMYRCGVGFKSVKGCPKSGVYFTIS